VRALGSKSSVTKRSKQTNKKQSCCFLRALKRPKLAFGFEKHFGVDGTPAGGAEPMYKPL
jgi:hypothetical protein